MKEGKKQKRENRKYADIVIVPSQKKLCLDWKTLRKKVGAKYIEAGGTRARLQKSAQQVKRIRLIGCAKKEGHRHRKEQSKKTASGEQYQKIELSKRSNSRRQKKSNGAKRGESCDASK